MGLGLMCLTPLISQSSRELKGLQDELKGLHVLWMVLTLGFAGTGGVLFLGSRDQELPGGVGVVDGGLGVEAEDRGAMSPPGEFARLQAPTAEQWTGRGLGNPSSGLQWSTIHGAKGRQAPAVGLVMPKSLFRDTEGLTALDHWEEGTSSEAKRVLYVGVSRAEQLLMLVVHKNHSDRVAGILARDEVPYL
ncbi:ATP-binding domain-containing protein [Nonomuraea sp. NN258]|uniref:ATP-binding domain-containing protein n=1 Tax=Nonomuraea antri TaxID=2730852 RepID=UPI0015688149|nr:ATP-binding domain-containing protein [Nonomuraea antri]NRQ34556.1 ATP-binding domain-containing protein [Nonomuraea antri]